jgi:hypothetical protein
MSVAVKKLILFDTLVEIVSDENKAICAFIKQGGNMYLFYGFVGKCRNRD